MAKKNDYKAIEQNEEAFKKFRDQFVMRQLRLATYRWPYGHMAMQRASIERGFKKCESCQGTFASKEVQKDHIVPVIDVQRGFTSWDDVINRLFIKSNDYQILCLSCHTNKTNIENEMRKKYGQKPLRVKKVLTNTKKRRRIDK